MTENDRRTHFMEAKNYTGIVPVHVTGTVIDTESFMEAKSIHAALKIYEIVKLRLIDINNWQNLTGEPMAAFQLTDSQGTDETGFVKKGQFIKIDIPGPGTESGMGHDWVRVEEIEEFVSQDVQSIGMRVRPSVNPAGTDDEIAHFYAKETTSSFVVTRENLKITAGVYDRNTMINKSSENPLDQLRNTVAGLSAKILLSRFQWKTLCEGLLEGVE